MDSHWVLNELMLYMCIILHLSCMAVTLHRRNTLTLIHCTWILINKCNAMNSSLHTYFPPNSGRSFYINNYPSTNNAYLVCYKSYLVNIRIHFWIGESIECCVKLIEHLHNFHGSSRIGIASAVCWKSNYSWKKKRHAVVSLGWYRSFVTKFICNTYW